MRLQGLAGGTGFFSAGIGVGGGAILMPGLMRLGGYDFRRASSLSLATIMPISLVGGLAHASLLKAELPAGPLIAFIASGMIGVSFGNRLIRRVPTRGLKSAFGLFLLVVSVKMLIGWQLASVSLNATSDLLGREPMISLTAFGLAIGFASSLLGVGGGLVIVPFCHLVLGFGMHLAIVFSLIAMFFLTSAGALGRFRKGLLDVRDAGRMIPSALVGAVCGAAFSSQLPDALLRTAFGAFLLYVGLKYLLEEVLRLLTVKESRHAEVCD